MMKPSQSDERIVDFRSDTVTKPCSRMKQFAMDCALGDDVYGEDPTINALEDKMAKMLNKPSALFLPTGTMSNLVALLAYCGRGEEILVGDKYHIYSAEAHGASVLGGIAMDPLNTDQFGAVKLDEVLRSIKPDDSHYAVTKLLCLENTVFGCVQDQEQLNKIASAARKNGLKTHLDGARLLNAAVAQNVSPLELVENMDSVSICLSKGVGAPIGSVLVGERNFIKKARRNRKLLGGGMRQAGILAACCIYGLDNNINRLAQDHANARNLAVGLASIEQLKIDLELVQTNMLFVEPAHEDRESLQAFLSEKNILIGGFSPSARMVVHLDISEDDISRTIDIFREFYKN